MPLPLRGSRTPSPPRAASIPARRPQPFAPVRRGPTPSGPYPAAPTPPPSETSPAAACGQLRPLTPGGGPGRAAVARRRIARPRGAARPPSRRAPAGLPCPPRYLRPSTALPRPPPAAPGLTEKQQQEEREQAGRPLPALPHAGGCLSLREADGGRRTRSARLGLTRLDSARLGSPRLPPPGDRRPLASRCPASARSRPPAPTGRAAPRSQPQRQTFPSARPRAPPPAGSGGGAGPVRSGPTRPPPLRREGRARPVCPQAAGNRAVIPLPAHVAGRGRAGGCGLPGAALGAGAAMALPDPDPRAPPLQPPPPC